MNKKKLMALMLVVAMLAIAIAGSTLAYFTDEAEVDNVFTMKGIKIELNEVFDPENAELAPGKNIEKRVTVTNTGTTDTYVRVHVAFPAALDDGDPTFAAYNNFLHWNFDWDSVADGQWSWIPEYTEGTGYKGNGVGNWNYYTTEIDGIEYAVYVATYRTALAPGETTATEAINNVYVDTTVKCEWDEEKQCFYYVDTKGNEVYPESFSDGDGQIHVLVFAEASQTDPFENAYDALNEAFGTPGEDGYVAPWNR